MSIIKEKIKYLGVDMNLKINLGSSDGFLGLQQEIDNLTQVVSVDLVNPPVDVEERRVNYLPGITPLSLSFRFYNSILSDWGATFLYAGFTLEELYDSTTNVLNSFFILDFYDSVDTTTQTKIFTTYLTKLISYDAYGVKVYTPTYTIGGSVPNQLYYQYLPVWYLESFTGNTAIGYAKFSFYNAKTGKIQSFYNYDNGTPLPGNYVNPEKMYFKVEINRPNRTWKMITTSFPNAYANELWDATAYKTKVDNSVQNFNNEQQDYPSGNTFNYVNGTYSTT
jgi:hypothetical protein